MKKTKSQFGRGDATVITKNGRDIVLLNPAQKGEKMARELKNDYKYTNTGVVKKAGLSKEERAFRAGYLASRKDDAKMYKYKKKKASTSSSDFLSNLHN